MPLTISFFKPALTFVQQNHSVFHLCLTVLPLTAQIDRFIYEGVSRFGVGTTGV